MHIQEPCIRYKKVAHDCQRANSLTEKLVNKRSTELVWFSYYVPTTLLAVACVAFDGNILAMPKSEILGFSSESNRILLAFKSLWMMRNREWLWRYRSPCAIPSTILVLVFHFSDVLLIGSTRNITQASVVVHKEYQFENEHFRLRTCQKWSGPSFCSSDIHRSTSSLLHGCNSQAA